MKMLIPPLSIIIAGIIGAWTIHRLEEKKEREARINRIMSKIENTENTP